MQRRYHGSRAQARPPPRMPGTQLPQVCQIVPAWTLGQGGPSPGLPHSLLWAAGPGGCSLLGNVLVSADDLHGVRLLEWIQQDACCWDSHSPTSRTCSAFKGVCTLVRVSFPPVAILATVLYNVTDDHLLWVLYRVLFVSFQTEDSLRAGTCGQDSPLCEPPATRACWLHVGWALTGDFTAWEAELTLSSLCLCT